MSAPLSVNLSSLNSCSPLPVLLGCAVLVNLFGIMFESEYLEASELESLKRSFRDSGLSDA